MNDDTKIATLNLCLGLRNKKEEIKELITTNNIDILCLQETEIPGNFPVEMLTFKGYNYENESCTDKSRCGIYVTDKVSYVRRCDLEVAGVHAIIIDLKDKKNTRIINVYRSFNPPNNQTQREHFDSLLHLLNANITNNTIMIGDFNLDYSKRFDINYSYKNYFTAFEMITSEHGLLQLINFPTWHRTINNVICTSILDHIYVKDPTQLSPLTQLKPHFGDHSMIMFTINSKKSNDKVYFRRNWKFYTPNLLNIELAKINWQNDYDDVQSYWNHFESTLIEVVDHLVPMEKSTNKLEKITPPRAIKSKINRRNNLIKKLKRNNLNPDNTRNELKSLNKDIKKFFHIKKTNRIRNGILPGNSKTLWNAVKLAKDMNANSLPEILYENNVEIPCSKQAEVFATFFSEKVIKITNSAEINPGIYNGKNKIIGTPEFFMSTKDIHECLKSIKIKNCEGYDRIPQRILVDGANLLLKPLTGLFSRIYNQKTVPAQWLVSKIIPIHKKGPKCNVENYRPIANLCSTSKIFERLILNKLKSIEFLNNTDLTGKQQHGFKKGKNTSTLALQLQSLIARSLDEDSYVLMASIDLSAAFDVINIDLLIRRLEILGLPIDIISLIEVWLNNRSLYVEINDLTSTFKDIKSGTIQGSILGPILYAIYVSPLFDLTDLSNFADDNFALTWSSNKNNVIELMTEKLKIITEWLKGSGLKVNETKTELCLFYRKDTPPVEVIVGNVAIKSMQSMNVLGVIFDSKLTWSKHISTQICRANKALHAIRMIKNFFSQSEIITLLTSNFYSILYYNSEVWHLPNLKPELNQMLLSSSANALKISQRHPDRMESFTNVHKNCKRALPIQIIEYKHAILLHKLYNDQIPVSDWVELNFNQILTSRQTLFKVTKNNNFKVGNNKLTSRISILNGKIPLNDLNLSLNAFKVKYKKIMLS